MYTSVDRIQIAHKEGNTLLTVPHLPAASYHSPRTVPEYLPRCRLAAEIMFRLYELCVFSKEV
jgi:hypothetical protein